MKRKVLYIFAAVALALIVVFLCVRPVVERRELRKLGDSIDSAAVYWVTVEDDEDWFGTASQMGNIEMLMKSLSHEKLVPYSGKYDPFDDSAMYFVFKYKERPYEIHRMGLILGDEPILTFGDKAYQISEELAKKYQETWERCRP